MPKYDNKPNSSSSSSDGAGNKRSGSSSSIGNSRKLPVLIKGRSSSKNKGIFSSNYIWIAFVLILSITIGLYRKDSYNFLINWLEKYSSDDQEKSPFTVNVEPPEEEEEVDDKSFLNIKKCPTRSSSLAVSKEKVRVYKWDRDNSIEFVSNILQSSEPAIIKNIPKELFDIFNIDLKTLAEGGLELNGTRYVILFIK